MDKELEIVKKFKENKYECNIIINETEEPYTLYQANHIAKLLGIKNIRESIKNYNDDEKYLANSNTNGGNQNITFLTYNGLIKFITLSRKYEAIEFSKNIGINIKSNKFICIENDTLKNIIEAFINEEIILQYSVNNYRIDLYFPKYNLAIECDEEHHKKYLLSDKIREDNIKDVIKDCKFIRYSPYDKDFNIFKVINEIYIYIIKNIT